MIQFSPLEMALLCSLLVVWLLGGWMAHIIYMVYNHAKYKIWITKLVINLIWPFMIIAVLLTKDEA